MGSLLLVRHGQASFLAEDYDHLSPVGEEQARRLGEAWARRGVLLDAVYFGPRRRQRRTGELVCEAMAARGLHVPAPVTLDELDEMQAQQLLQVGLSSEVAGGLAAEPRFRALAELVQQSMERSGRSPASGKEARREFERLFQSLMADWVAGRLEAPGPGPRPRIESWQDFGDRVRGALSLMMGGGRRVAAFTSGGPIAIALQRACEMSDAATLSVTATVRNASVSEFLFSGPRFSLSLYNEVSHLGDEQRLLTYR